MKIKEFKKELEQAEDKNRALFKKLGKYDSTLVLEVKEGSIPFVKTVTKRKQIKQIKIIRELLLEEHRLSRESFRFRPRKIYNKSERSEIEKYRNECQFITTYAYDLCWSEEMEKEEVGFLQGWRIFFK